MKNIKGFDGEQKSIQNAVLAVALITNFFNPFAMTALNIAIPNIGREFHMPATALTWIVLLFILVIALLSIPFGRIADIYGRGKIMKAGILLVCIMNVLIIFSPNMTVFFVFRALQGFGAAAIFATNIAIVVGVFPVEKRGSVLGISVAAVYVGAACGPVGGGFLTHHFGWRGVFVAVAALAFVSFIMAVARLPREAGYKDVPKLSVSSIFLYILSLGLSLYGLATLMQGPLSWALFAAGIILLVIFGKHEGRTEAPLIQVRLFRNRSFTFATLASLFNYTSIFVIGYSMSIYLQLVKGFSADVSGVIMICQPVIQVVLSPITGRLSDRKSPAILASTGMACCAVALGMYAFLDEQTPLPYIIAGMVLTGFGVGFFTPPNSNMIMGSVSAKEYGLASSVTSTSRTVGQVTGMAILMIIINAVMGDMAITEVPSGMIVQYMHISFAIFAGTCIVGVFLSLAPGRKRPGPPSDVVVKREE